MFKHLILYRHLRLGFPVPVKNFTFAFAAAITFLTEALGVEIPRTESPLGLAINYSIQIYPFRIRLIFCPP